MSCRAYAGSTAAAEPVEAVGEAGAVREPDGVRARERDHVARGEVALGEHGDEVLDAHVGSRQPARDVAGLGDEAVHPAELDGPVRAGRLPCSCHNHRVKHRRDRDDDGTAFVRAKLNSHADDDVPGSDDEDCQHRRPRRGTSSRPRPWCGLWGRNRRRQGTPCRVRRPCHGTQR
jgi:hypothetical protein